MGHLTISGQTPHLSFTVALHIVFLLFRSFATISRSYFVLLFSQSFQNGYALLRFYGLFRRYLLLLCGLILRRCFIRLFTFTRLAGFVNSSSSLVNGTTNWTACSALSLLLVSKQEITHISSSSNLICFIVSALLSSSHGFSAPGSVSHVP